MSRYGNYTAVEMLRALAEQRRIHHGDSILCEYTIRLRWPSADGRRLALDESGYLCASKAYNPDVICEQLRDGLTHPRARPEGATGPPVVTYFDVYPLDDIDMDCLRDQAGCYAP